MINVSFGDCAGTLEYLAHHRAAFPGAAAAALADMLEPVLRGAVLHGAVHEEMAAESAVGSIGLCSNSIQILLAFSAAIVLR